MTKRVVTCIVSWTHKVLDIEKKLELIKKQTT